jgi:hypothetical protein
MIKMKYFLISLLVIPVANAFCQTQAQNDSIVSKICKTIEANTSLEDSLRIVSAMQLHLPNYLKRFDESKHEDIGQNIFFRLQRNCDIFLQILTKNIPPKGDWRILDEKPTTSLTKKTCRSFNNHQEFTYTESAGGIVKIIHQNNSWINHFEDGTYSKLKFRWVGDCEYEIKFIESNNLIRKNLSKPGDKYRYLILDVQENAYSISGEVTGSNQFTYFKLYFK